MGEEAKRELRVKTLEKKFVKSLSKMVGRGILSLGTKEIIPTEMIQFPKISTQAIDAADNNSRVYVDIKEETLKELLHWPNFHNGASSAFKIVMSLTARETDPSSSFMVRTWIK